MNMFEAYVFAKAETLALAITLALAFALSFQVAYLSRMETTCQSHVLEAI